MPVVYNYLNMGREEKRSEEVSDISAEDRGRQKMSSTGRKKEREMAETNFKGQCLSSLTLCSRWILFENVRKRDSKWESGRGGERPIMTETVRKVHKPWLTAAGYLFHASLMPIRNRTATFQGVSPALVSPSFQNTQQSFKTGGRETWGWWKWKYEEKIGWLVLQALSRYSGFLQQSKNIYV